MKAIIAKTADGSTWLLDDDFIERAFKEYCAQEEFVTDLTCLEDDKFLDFINDEIIDGQDLEFWLYPNARLASVSGEAGYLFDLGCSAVSRDEIDNWIASDEFNSDANWSPIENAYANGWKQAELEFASSDAIEYLKKLGYFTTRNS